MFIPLFVITIIVVMIFINIGGTAVFSGPIPNRSHEDRDASAVRDILAARDP